jgi:hypothetical protein
MGKRLIITEEEKNDILMQYNKQNNNLIGEDFGMIPNPKKEITVDLPIEIVKKILNRKTFLNLLEPIKNGYIFTGYDEFLNQYTLSKTEFLSLGVNIDITLESVSNDKTKITIEVKRALGSFDNSMEVQLAQEHIQNILKAISSGSNPETLKKAQERRRGEPGSMLYMGFDTLQDWKDAGEPDTINMYKMGFDSYQEWVDAGKPPIKTPRQIEKEKKELERKNNPQPEKKGFLSKLFGK